MSLMYSLQIFVKLVPFVTAHNSDIFIYFFKSHIEVYYYPHNFQLFSGHRPRPEQEEKTQVFSAGLLVPSMTLLFLFPSTREPGGRLTIFSQVCTPVKHSARQTKQKNHMHTKDVAWEG